MESIKQIYHIQAPVKIVWRALTDPIDIEKWSGSPATMDDTVGTHFKLWSGDVWGTNTLVKAPHTLSQDWFGGDWPEPSQVTFNLSAEDTGTLLELTHTNIPDNEVKDIEEGWKDYYLGPLKEIVENDPTL